MAFIEKFMRKNFYGLLAGVVLILAAFDIVVLAKALLGLEPTVVINLVVIGGLLVAYGEAIGDPKDQLYYVFWGLFIILIGFSYLLYWLTMDWVYGTALFLGGLGGLIAYVSFKQK